MPACFLLLALTTPSLAGICACDWRPRRDCACVMDGPAQHLTLHHRMPDWPKLNQSSERAERNLRATVGCLSLHAWCFYWRKN